MSMLTSYYTNLKIVNKATFKRGARTIWATPLIVLALYLIDITFPSNWFVEEFGKDIFYLREWILNFLFRVAPFFVTIVMAISSLTINSYTGTFLVFLLQDRGIRFLAVYSLGYFVFHLCVILICENELSSNLDANYIRYFTLYAIDGLLGFANLLFAVLTSLNTFLYSWPKVIKNNLKNSVLSEIIKTEDIMKVAPYTSPGSTTAEQFEDILKNSKITLSKNISLFTNLLMKAIKSKDYATVQDINIDICKVWGDLVKVSSQAKAELDKRFWELIELIGENDPEPDLGLETGFYTSVFEDTVYQIERVFVEAYEVSFTEGEYFICEEIINSVASLADQNDINKEDYDKILKMLLSFFEISLRSDKKGQTEKYAESILNKINELYNSVEFEQQKISDYNVYYSLISHTIVLNNPKILNLVLEKFKLVFNDSVKDRLYSDTIFQLQKLLMYCLKKKRMTCFAELIRFTVVGSLKLDIVNLIFSQSIAFEGEEISEVQDVLNSLVDGSDKEINYSRENYYYLKLYIIWYSYYLLQARISADRIKSVYLEKPIEIPERIESKIGFEWIRTVLLDLETHHVNWTKLFVKQEGYYFSYTSSLLLDKVEVDKVKNEQDQYGDSKLLSKLNDFIATS